MFLRLLISKSHVTTFAAIQLVIMQAMTSLMFSSALSMPGIAPQSAPAAMPPRNASSQMITGETCSDGMLSAMKSVAHVPARYCPGAPMLKRPVLNAVATERPVRISGVARKNMLPTLVGLKPNVSAPEASRPVLKSPNRTSRMPSHALLSPSDLLETPTMRMSTAPTRRPMRMESSEAMTERVLSLCQKEVFCSFISSPPRSAASRPPCKGRAPPR